MLRAMANQNPKSKHDLKKIGQRLRKLIQQHDTPSLTEALNIIETHQNDSEVINAHHFNQSTPLILACEFGKTEIVKKLLGTNCIDINSKGHAKTNALETALKAKQFEIASLLASDMRTNINATGADGIHPALRALDMDSGCPFEVARLIISRPNANLNCVYDDTSTHYHAHRTILHSLLRKIISFKRLSEVHGIYSENEAKKYLEGLALLSQVMAAQNIDVNPLVHEIFKENVAKNHLEGMALLRQVLARNIDVNAFEIYQGRNAPKEKTTALMMAVNAFMPELVSILLAAGADTELRNENKQRAIDIAEAFISAHQGSGLCQPASEICEMIKSNKHQPACRQSSMSMFASPDNMPAARPVPPEYFVPPKPSAPPAEDLNEDADTCWRKP